MEFITKSTRVRSIVASAITGVALITLIMLSSLLQLGDTKRNVMCLIYTVSLLLILICWHGIIQIKVFNDYKCQNKHLCADGVLSICLSSLLAISSILFGILQVSKVIEGGFIKGAETDIRIFLIVFLAVMFIWKLAIMIVSMKKKRFNWWCDMLFAICWLALTATVITSLFFKGAGLETISWIGSVIGWLLIITTIVYTLYSYVFKQPSYLETPRAVEIKTKEQEDYEMRQRRLDSSIGISENKIEDKLRKLKELAEQGYITTQEYNKRRKELLDREL